jgi:hypothetical protein
VKRCEENNNTPNKEQPNVYCGKDPGGNPETHDGDSQQKLLIDNAENFSPSSVNNSLALVSPFSTCDGEDENI